MGSDAVRPVDVGGSDGSHTPPALIASFPFDGNYNDAASGTAAVLHERGGEWLPGGSRRRTTPGGSAASFDGATCVIAPARGETSPRSRSRCG